MHSSSPPAPFYTKRRGFLAYKNGQDAEKKALVYFQNQGFSLLAHRQRTPLGEIDLLVANKEWLIAIEVKQRRSLSQGAYALQPQQAQRLLQALDYILATSPKWQRPNTRFDVLLFDETGHHHHIQDALRLS